MKLLNLGLFRTVSTIAILGVNAVGTGAWAQEVEKEEQSEGGLDVIVVTAQKRETNLQDTPISVSTISGEKIAAQGIQRPEELAALIPNFSIQQDPIGDKINIRGIQSGNNAGLEQSVATFVDGVYRGRGVQTRFAFLDVGRVEVLRGPQGTLFGKNTNGGAINITSARPTDEFSGALSGGVTFDGVDEYEFSGHVTGPLSDTLRARFAGRYRDLDKGYVRNIFYNQDEPTLKEYAFRGTLEWDATPDTLVTLRGEYGNFDQFGQPFGNIAAGPLALFVDTQEGSFNTTNVGSINSVLDIGSAGNNTGETIEVSLTVVHEFDFGTLNLIGAFSDYDFQRECDCDFSAVDVLRFDDREDFNQLSLEARFDGEIGNIVDYTIGGYYQNSNLFAEADTFFNVRGTGAEIAVDTALNAGCNFLSGLGADPATTRECILIGVVQLFDGTPLEYSDFTRRHFLDQDDELAAAFANVTFNITDRFRLAVGARFAHERKTAQQGAFAIEFGSEDNPVINSVVGQTQLYIDAITAANPGIDPAVAAATGAALDPFFSLGEAEIHENALGRKENSLTWSANASYNLTDDILLYAGASTGFKAGGFNSFALRADPAEAEFEEEQVLGFEAGAKFTLLNGNAELNIALFNSDFDDIQTAIFTGSTSFVVQNAAAARSRGFEVDGRWAVTDSLLLTGGFAYVDFKFGSFPTAACFAEQLLAFRAGTGNPLATVQNCSRPTFAEAEGLFAAGLIDAAPVDGVATASLNDLTGRTSENTPKWSSSVSVQHTLELGSDYKLVNVVGLNYFSSQFRQADLDPVSLQGAYAKIDLTTTFGQIDGNWDISLFVKNLTDKNTFNYVNDTPLFDTARQFAPERPRTIGVRGNFRF